MNNLVSYKLLKDSLAEKKGKSLKAKSILLPFGMHLRTFQTKFLRKDQKIWDSIFPQQTYKISKTSKDFHFPNL